MKTNARLYLVIIFGLIISSLTSIIRAQEIQVETAEKPIPFLSFLDGKENVKIETSAVASIDVAGNFLLAVDDEETQLMVVDAKSGRIVKNLSIKGVANRPKPKWEALARDDEGAYYVVASHSLKEGETDAEKLKARSRLFRFRLKSTDSDLAAITIDEASVTEWSIADSIVSEEQISNPNKSKAKVEGLAVRTLFNADKTVLKRELIVGLREPNNPVRVLSADITRLPEPNAKLKLTRLFIFNPGTSKKVELRLSSIEYVPAWKGFLILTSTEDKENKFHGNVLWFLSDEKIIPAQPELTPVNPQKVWTFGIDQKAEGICLLPASANTAKIIQAVLVYDNDVETTEKSSSIQKIVLANWTK